jgi:hypothetical protein
MYGILNKSGERRVSGERVKQNSFTKFMSYMYLYIARTASSLPVGDVDSSLFPLWRLQICTDIQFDPSVAGQRLDKNVYCCGVHC